MTDALADQHAETFTLPLVLIFQARDDLLVVELQSGGEVLGAKYVPLQLFKSDGDRLLFQSLVKSKFLEFASRALAGEAFLHLADMVELAAADVGLDVWADKDREHAARQIIGGHLGHTAHRLRAILEVADLRGRRSEWDAFDLKMAIKAVLPGLAKDKRTYHFINRALQKQFPDKAPATGEALRKLMERFDLSLKALKNGQ